jgi:ABC-type multidrug transport system fused ATPase/permease subunit
MTLMALMQVVGIASITPFLALVGNPDIVERNIYLSAAYDRLGFESLRSFMIFTGLAGLGILLLSNAFTAVTTWFMLRFSWGTYHSISERLLESYLRRPYEFFLDRNSTELGKNTLSEVSLTVRGLLIPGMHMISKAMVTLFVLVLLVLVDPLLAAMSFGMLGGAYALIFGLVRRKLSALGKAKVTTNRERYHAAVEALAGAKEIKLLGKERFFLKRYSIPSRRYIRYNATTQIIGHLPRYGLEAMAFGGMFLIVIYLLLRGENPGQVLPVLALYGFALYRLMPALQMIFQSLASVRSHLASLDAVYDDLAVPVPPFPDRSKVTPLPFRQEINLRNIRFRYPGAESPVIDGLDLRIRANTSVAFVGPTGAGKSTIVDLILGLLRPERGELVVDGRVIDDRLLPSWQKSLGYVPQQIYLNDDTIANNIAFGIRAGALDMQAVTRAARLADIHDFIERLPDGYETRVGERGVRLSGGQRQRLGIARALYHDPDVLVLDEATSALDGITEESIFRAVSSLATAKTVIMIAHRVTTVRDCDVIYFLDRGRIKDQGQYIDLLRRNPTFKAMAQVAPGDWEGPDESGELESRAVESG